MCFGRVSPAEVKPRGTHSPPPIDSVLWKDWLDSTKTSLTRRVADDGFDRAATIEAVSLEMVYDDSW